MNEKCDILPLTIAFPETQKPNHSNLWSGKKGKKYKENVKQMAKSALSVLGAQNKFQVTRLFQLFSWMLFLSGGCEADYTRMLNVPGEQVSTSYFNIGWLRVKYLNIAALILGDLPWWPPLGRYNKVRKGLTF